MTIEETIEQMKRFADDAGLYGKFCASGNPRDVINAHKLQEAMKSRHPQEVCDKFFKHFGGEIRKIG